MKERPIIFNGWEVRAVLAGTKTQTRRIIPVASRGGYIIAVRDGVPYREPNFNSERSEREERLRVRCPFGVPGDRLFIKETFELRREFDNLSPAAVGKRHGSDVLYLADQGINPSGCHGHFEWGRTRSSIHMPRWASRITMEVERVRVQRVQDISNADILAEGWDARSSEPVTDGTAGEDARAWFAALWNSIHGPGAWERNDWVWAVTFRRLEVDHA